MDQQTVRIDKIIWWIYVDAGGIRRVQPICPIHHLRIRPVKIGYIKYLSNALHLRCQDCKTLHSIPRGYDDETEYVLDRIDSKIFKGMKVLNLDDEALLVSEEKLSPKDSKYFVTSLLTKSKSGLRLVVYAGEKGRKEKSQIFVEPDIKRLAFDQKDLHPTDIFTKLEATFADGTKYLLEK